MPIIDVAATGANIKSMMRTKGFKVSDVQARCGFDSLHGYQWRAGSAPCFALRNCAVCFANMRPPYLGK